MIDINKLLDAVNSRVRIWNLASEHTTELEAKRMCAKVFANNTFLQGVKIKQDCGKWYVLTWLKGDGYAK